MVFEYFTEVSTQHCIFVRFTHYFSKPCCLDNRGQLIMIEVVIFHAHIVGALYAFTRRWQEENLKEGALALGLVGLVFTVCWGVTGSLAKLIMPPGSSLAPWFTADTLSLVLLIVPEILLFRMFFLNRVRKTVLSETE
jgi:hypothetical protein